MVAETGPFLAVVAAAIMSDPDKYPSVRTLAVELPTTYRRVGIVTLKKRTISPLARTFIACAREIANCLRRAMLQNRGIRNG